MDWRCRISYESWQRLQACKCRSAYMFNLLFADRLEVQNPQQHQQQQAAIARQLGGGPNAQLPLQRLSPAGHPAGHGHLQPAAPDRPSSGPARSTFRPLKAALFIRHTYGIHGLSAARTVHLLSRQREGGRGCVYLRCTESDVRLTCRGGCALPSIRPPAFRGDSQLITRDTMRQSLGSDFGLV